ncbi:MAG: zf-HC2 domain-containing protein [Anaerolineales bacterium]
MNVLSHTKARQWIEKAADGILQPGEQLTLQQHLHGCAECSQVANELSAFEFGLRSALHSPLAQSELPADRKEQLIRDLQSKFSPGGSGAGLGLRWLLWLVPLLTLALLYLGFQGNLSSLPIAAATATSNPTRTNTASSTSTATSRPTQQSPQPLIVPVLIAIPTQNVNCRAGNGSTFDIEDTLLAAQEYAPNARGFDDLWVRFSGPVTNVPCWVFVNNLDFFISEEPVDLPDIPESLLPFAAYPPTPTPTMDEDEGSDPTHTPAIGKLPTSTHTPRNTPVPSATPRPQCSDGMDNDGDGLVDFDPAGGGDPQCRNANDNSEAVP